MHRPSGIAADLLQRDASASSLGSERRHRVVHAVGGQLGLRQRIALGFGSRSRFFTSGRYASSCPHSLTGSSIGLLHVITVKPVSLDSANISTN